MTFFKTQLYLIFHFTVSARSELTEKVKRILNKQFEIEMNQQQSELEEIENNIVKVQENLLLLRSVATTSFYSKVDHALIFLFENLHHLIGNFF